MFPSNVELGFGEKESPLGFQKIPDFGEQPPLIGNFMNHPERKNEIGLIVRSQRIQSRPMSLNPISHAFSPGPRGHDRKHFFLEIDGRNAA